MTHPFLPINTAQSPLGFSNKYTPFHRLHKFQNLPPRGEREREMAADAVIACHTVDQWNQQLQQANYSKKLVVVDFTATWCGPCRLVAPIFEELAKKFTETIFLKVDVDELGSVAEEFKVKAMPTFVYLKEGREVERIVGAVKKDDMIKAIEPNL